MNGFVHPLQPHSKLIAIAFDELLETDSIDMIDVREPMKLPEVDEFDHQKIPCQQVET